MSYLNHVLKDKMTKTSEIEVHLFEFCNLNCSFCGQDHDSTVGMDSITDKAYLIVDFIKKSPLNDHVVNLMGGELFNDLVPESVWNDYLFLCRYVRDYCNLHEQTVRFNWVTNLIFSKNRENVKKLLDKAGKNVYLSTSYDFSGRGVIKTEKEMSFHENLEYFKDRIGVVGFVLTKPAIRAMFLDKKNKFSEFDYLYQNYPLYFDYYVPEKSAAKLMPSEEDMLKAFSYIAEEYPLVEPIKSMLENEHNQMTCFSLNKTTILPDGEQVKCRYLKYEEKDFLTEVNYTSNENIIEAHLDRNGCLGCEYFNRCQFRCFVQADWTRLKRLDDCFIRQFFQSHLEKENHHGGTSLR